MSSLVTSSHFASSSLSLPRLSRLAARTEKLLGVAASTASIVDAGLSRKTHNRHLRWRQEDVEYRRDERAFLEEERARFREQVRWRRADLRQRRLVNQRRAIEEKTEFLRSTSGMAALIAGFKVTVLVVVMIGSDAPVALLGVWATFTSLAICFMTYSFVSATLMLVGTLKKFEMGLITVSDHVGEEEVAGEREDDQSEQNEGAIGTREKMDFNRFWETHCRPDWERSARTFMLGMATFFLNLIFVATLRFWDISGGLAPTIVLIVVFSLSLIILYVLTYLKWGVFVFERESPTTSAAHAPPTSNDVVVVDHHRDVDV